MAGQIGVLAFERHVDGVLVVYCTDENLAERGSGRNDGFVRLLRIGPGRRLILRGGLSVWIALRGLAFTRLKRGDEERQSQ